MGIALLIIFTKQFSNPISIYYGRDDQLDIGLQFLTESLSLAAIGGVVGIIAGISITGIYSYFQDWTIVLPGYAILGGMISSVLIGGFAGSYPALKASHMSPTEALRTK